ncbi:MAG: hypothetical protein AAGC88_14535 [Bacteroidota bacterium]
MRNVWLTYIYYAITAVSVVVLFLSVKFLLGGYDEIVIGPSEEINYVIAGKYVDENWSEDEIDTFKGELSEKTSSSTKMVEVVFFPDSISGVASTSFLGIAMQGNIVTIPAGYEVIDIYEKEGLETTLMMHPLVRPSITDIRNQIEAKAETNDKLVDDRLLVFEGQSDSLTIVSGVK